MDQPEKLKTAAMIQVGSGLFNLFFMSGVSAFGLSMLGGILTGICTLGMFPIGSCCGVLGIALAPLGILEIIAGGLGLTNNPNAGKMMGIVSNLELASIVAGGVGSAVAGFVVRGMFADPEVAAYIESTS